METRFIPTLFMPTGVTCCPARTGLMTSKWPASYPVYPANGGFAESRGDRGAAAHKNGAPRPVHFGEWHIGPEDQARPGTYGIDVISARAAGEDKETNTAGSRCAHL